MEKFLNIKDSHDTQKECRGKMKRSRVPDNMPKIPRIGDTTQKPVTFGYRIDEQAIDTQDYWPEMDLDEIMIPKEELKFADDQRKRMIPINRMGDMRF